MIKFKIITAFEPESINKKLSHFNDKHEIISTQLSVCCKINVTIFSILIEYKER